MSDVETLASQIVEGSTRALARGLTWVESGGKRAEALSAQLYPHTGRAQIVGVTGAPGSGKSTLVRSLALVARARGRTVGVVAVDPSSPFSGGAILGDRIRMNDLALDPGVFIRSMAARWAVCVAPRRTPSTSWTPPGEASSSSRPSASGRTRWT